MDARRLIVSFFRPAPLGAAAGLLAVGMEDAVAAERAGQGATREMRTDRPDTTESPFTVDPGRVQLEMDFATFQRDRVDGARTSAWEVAPLNLRHGVTRDFELGVFLAPWQQAGETPGGRPRQTRRGAGDAALRGKWNFTGNDSGALATGIILDLKLPTARRGLGNGKLEAALTLPMAFELSGGWEGGAMTSLAASYLDAGHYRPTWLNSVTLGRELAGPMAGYVELTSLAGDGAHAATFNCGLTYAASRDLQFDAGANFGVSRAAPDLLVSAGMSRRF